MSPLLSLNGARGSTVIKSPSRMVGCMLLPGARKRTPKPRLNKSPLKRLRFGDKARVLNAKSSAFTVSKSSHEPGPAQGGMGAPQAGGSGPPPPELLQKARTAHLPSKLTRLTSGFLYSFFLPFSMFPYQYRFSQFSLAFSSQPSAISEKFLNPQSAIRIPQLFSPSSVLCRLSSVISFLISRHRIYKTSPTAATTAAFTSTSIIWRVFIVWRICTLRATTGLL